MMLLLWKKAVLTISDLFNKKKIPLFYLQFMLYIFVGCICATFDVGGFWILRRFDVSLIVASMSSFIIATFVNYFLSYKLVFSRGRFSKNNEIIRLFIVSFIGLGLNTIVVYTLANLTLMSSIVIKVIAIPIVLIWNFMGRRIFVFHENLPSSDDKMAR